MTGALGSKIVEVEPVQGRDGTWWRAYAVVPLDDPRPSTSVPPAPAPPAPREV